MRSTIQEVGTLIIGGLAFLSMLALYARVSNSAFTQTMTTTVHEGHTSSTQVIERELRTAGFGIADSVVILAADTNGVTFRSDLDANGIIDTVSYMLGPVAAGGKHTLMRRVSANGRLSVMPVAANISKFRMTYRDAAGNNAATLRSIRSITISMLMEGTGQIDEPVQGVCWERTIKPNNLR